MSISAAGMFAALGGAAFLTTSMFSAWRMRCAITARLFFSLHTKFFFEAKWNLARASLPCMSGRRSIVMVWLANAVLARSDGSGRPRYFSPEKASIEPTAST